MPIVFPVNPVEGQVFQPFDNIKYQYTGSRWSKYVHNQPESSFVIVNPSDVAASVYGKPKASEEITRVHAGRAFKIYGTVKAKAKVAATALTTFSILKDELVIGSVTFSAGATVANSTELDTTFPAGTTLILKAPAGVDATLSDIDFYITANLVS